MRSRLNRLERMGKLSFNRIVDPEEFASVLDEIIPLHDFRQGAAHLNFPFSSDRLKKPFHLAIMKHPNLLHVTVLQLNSRIAAAHIGLCNKEQVSLGILAHSPMFSQYSVGKFHILLLGLYLQKEGFTDLDLTPGGEQYKERFASHRDEAYMLDVLLRPSLVRQFRLHLGDPMRFDASTRLRAKEVVARVQHRAKLIKWLGLSGELIRRLKAATWNTKEFCLYSWNRASVGVEQPHTTMRRDCLQDLLLFKPLEPWQPPQHEFLREAARRLKAEKQHIDIFVLKNNAAEGRVIETAGFEYQKSFFERNRFGMVSRWEGRRQMSPYLKKPLQRNERPI